MLHIGQTFENYTELCLFIGEPPKTGGAKKNQLKNWETYFQFSKKGHKITITQVFKEFSDIAARERKQKDGIFLQDLTLLILNKLSSEGISPNLDIPNYKEIYITVSESLITYGLCHPRFKKLKTKSIWEFLSEKDQELLLTFDPQSKVQLSEGASFSDLVKYSSPIVTTALTLVDPLLPEKLSDHIRLKFREILESSLENLTRRCILDFKNSHLIRLEKSNGFRAAADPEQATITEVHKKILTEFQLKEYRDIFLQKRHKAFFKRRKELLKEIGILEIKKAYIVFFNESQIANSEDYRQALEATLKAQKSLNEKFHFYFKKFYLKTSRSSIEQNSITSMLKFSMDFNYSEESI